jgi:plasmid stabilization system protein ParE
MPLRIEVSARAAGQVRQAAAWWSANRPSAPGAVAKELAESIALLAEQPGIGARYGGSLTPSVRRLFLGRIGYFVYYRATNDTLEVLALWHGSRGSQPPL